jgi:hypothetical protein
LVASRLQTPRPFVTSFEEIPYPNIELMNLIQIIRRKILWIEDWDELRISHQSRIWSKIGGDLLCLILKNQSSSGLEGMIVSKRQINGLVKADICRILSNTRPHQHQEKCRGRGEYPKVPGAHKC